MIELRKVQKKFGARTAVSDLTLAVPRGEVFGFLGHNGAGKSTAIGMMLGQVWPTSGEVRVCGHDVTSHRARALHKVGAIFEAPAFYDYLSGWRNLEILSHYTAPTSKERIRQVVEWVGLTGREHGLVRTYSHGMRARLALAQALLIVEARLGSGSLTSVRWAADLGREVLVVPGPIDSQLSEAPITLLREGATAVGSPDHILEAVGLSVMAPRAPALGSPTELSPAEGRLLALLEGGGADVDDLIVLSGESPSRVLSLVLALEARGLIVREADGRSVRANRPSPEGRAAVHELSEEVQRGAAERDVDQVPAEGPDSHAHDVP